MAMKTSLLPIVLWSVACGSGGASDDGDPLPCAPPANLPAGAQVWSATPEGACMQAASANVTGRFALARFLPDGGARFLATTDGVSTTYHAALDGAHPVEVASGTLSPDGTRVASVASDDHDGLDARVSDVDGSHEVVRTDLDFVDRADGLQWSPTSDKLMLNLENTSTAFGDGPMLVDRELVTVGNYVGQFYEGQARWSPDGSRLVIDGSTTDEDGLWLIPIDGGPVTHLTTGIEESADWLDDDRLIAIRNTTASFEGPYELVTVDAASGAVTPLVTMSEAGFVSFRDVAPDGKTIAVWRAGTATTESQLYFIEVDGGAVTPVGDTGLSGWYGEFSPDNRYFVASAGPLGQTARLYRAARDGSDVTPLTGDNAIFAGWSADGARMMWTGAALTDPR